LISVLLDDWCAHIQACCTQSEEKYCRETSAIEWMASHHGLVASRIDPEHMAVRDAVLGLRSLKILLDDLPASDQFDIVWSRVKTAISSQSSSSVEPRLGDVFPRLRPPLDAQDLSWFEPIANGRLLECLVSDESDTVRYLDALRIVGFGLGVRGVRSRSRSNLRALGAVFVPLAEEPRIQICRMGDGHDAARLLIASDLMNGMDTVLCCAPDRDTLLCADPSQSDIQYVARKMREMGVVYATQAAYPLSAECFLVDGLTVRHIPFHSDEEEVLFSGL
jgi:hypothetical protein